MNFTITETTNRVNELTPVEEILREITLLKMEAQKIGLQNDVNVLEGVENVIFKHLQSGIEERKIVQYGMSLLSSTIDETEFTNEMLDNIFNRSKECFDVIFNAKFEFIKHTIKQNGK